MHSNKKKKDLPVVLDKHILGFNAGAELFWGGGVRKRVSLLLWGDSIGAVWTIIAKSKTDHRRGNLGRCHLNRTMGTAYTSKCLEIPCHIFTGGIPEDGLSSGSWPALLYFLNKVWEHRRRQRKALICLAEEQDTRALRLALSPLSPLIHAHNKKNNKWGRKLWKMRNLAGEWEILKFQTSLEFGSDLKATLLAEEVLQRQG